MFNKIVRTPQLQSDPVLIKASNEPEKESDEPIVEENPDEESEEESIEEKSGGSGGGSNSGIDEEALNTMLAEIAAKEQRAIQKLKDAEVQANILKQEAENERQRLLDEVKAESERAKADIEKAKAEARKKGHAEGFKEGQEKGHEEGVKAATKQFADTLQEANAKAEQTLQNAKEATAEYFVRAEQDIAKIVMLAIEKILPQHFLDVPQVVLPVVREAIKKVRDQKEIKIHVAPDYYDIVLMAKGEFQAMLTDGTAILEVVSDSALGEGDCVIETPNGGVDARLLTQIELMKDAIQSVI